MIVPAHANVENPINQVQQPIPVVEPQAQLQAQPQALQQVEQNPGVVLVNRNQNADDVVRNVQNNNFIGQNNIANLVETILTQNGYQHETPPNYHCKGKRQESRLFYFDVPLLFCYNIIMVAKVCPQNPSSFI
jgi:hypothetical protein